LIGLDLPEDIDGISRVPEILAAASGEELSNSETVGISLLDETWGRNEAESVIRIAVTEGAYRYVMRGPAPGSDAISSEELFDAASDPAELEDVSSSQPEVVEKLRAIAEDHLDEVPSWGEAPKRDIGELELHQLRALGYAIP
jgi:hypothetical protein